MVAIGVALGVAAIVGLIAATAFFVAGEFAIVAADRNEIERRAAGGSRRAASAAKAIGTLSFQLSGAQLGITLCSILLGVVAEPVFIRIMAPLFRLFGVEPTAYAGVAATVGLVVSTIVLMLAGELLPKNYAIARPIGAILTVGVAMRWVNIAFGPLIGFFNGAANLTLRLLGIEPREELRRGRSLDELDLVVAAAAAGGVLDEKEAKIVSRSVQFVSKTAADVLVPRTAAATIRPDADIGELVRTAVASGHSRFPVAGPDFDAVAGVVHVKDAFAIPAAGRSSTPISAIVKPAFTIPESMPLGALLVSLRTEGAQIAIVVDEHGDPAGVVTMEDILEELVGDIRDEFDFSETESVRRMWKGAWEVDGVARPDELRDMTGFALPDGPWETLAGFLLYHFGFIPDIGQSVEREGWRFTVREVRGRRIARVLVQAPTVAKAPR